MKKILLTLSVVFVTVAALAQLNPDTEWPYVNPYVYDMESSIVTQNKYIRLTYTLSGKSFGNDLEYASLNSSRGIQIYLLYKDAQGEWQRITDLNTGYNGVSTGGKIVSGGYANAQTYNVDIDLGAIPAKYKNGDIAWEAVVHGNKGRTKPQLVNAVPAGTHQPTNAFGIAVNTNPDHSRFAQIFASEAYPSKRTGYTNANAGTMVEYGPWLDRMICPHHKHYHNGNSGAYFNTLDGLYYEPHRVKISEDGRMFVSSYHPKALCAVYEYVSPYNYHNVVDYNWNTAEVKGSDSDPLLYKRCIGMDVKGSGDSLKIVLGWIDANGDGGNKAKLEVWEYALGDAEDDGAYYVPSGYLAAFTEGQYVRKIGEYAIDKQTEGAEKGLLCQGFNGKWNNALFGFVDLAYGNNDDVWIKVDYAANADVSEGRLIRMSTKGAFETTVVASLPTTADGFYGGSGIYIKDNMLVTGSGENKIRFYDIAYSADGKTASLTEKTDWCITDNRIGRWVTGIAEDYAGNLYVTSEGNNWTSGKTYYTSNVLAIAMPYSGSMKTRAKSTPIPLNPIPNILATDLRYTPVGNTDKYAFSFNVNTKPAVAQIRFYSSYDNMKKSIDVVHSDTYDGLSGIEPEFVYNIPASRLKQGKISVVLNMCGGAVSGTRGDGACMITNDSLPAGEWYWSVYVEAPRRSTQFAPMYRLEGITHETDGDQRRYITVNNYPETDMFGSLFVGYNARNTDDATRANRGLHIHGINEDGNSNDEQTNITSTTRYTKRVEYLNRHVTEGRLHYPRRLTVAPDGKVFIADEGDPSTGGGATIQYHQYGGVKMWDPADPFKFKTFSDNILGTATGVALWQHGSQWKLYATNTYDEFSNHGTNYKGTPSELGSKDDYSDAPNAFGRNGYVEYLLKGTFSGFDSRTQRHYKKGDASGNMGIVAMDKGIWFCQHREHTVAVKIAAKSGNPALADNLDAYILAFMPYGTSDKTWTSCTANGLNTSWQLTSDGSAFSQKTNSPVQSTPGGGIAYRKYKVAGGVQKEYLFIPDHDGNIARLEITGWSGSGTTAKPTIPIANITKLITPEYLKGTRAVVTGVTWKTSFITSMEFDYAGNLVTTAGKGNHDAPQDIVIYTMPYPDRVNAQEIQAPNSCRYIPERISQTYDEHNIVIDPYVVSGKSCGLDVYRPMMKGSFNTICLPFSMTAEQIAQSPYAGATIMRYAGASYRTQDGEGMVDFNFEPVTAITAGEPYLIQLPETSAIRGIVRFEPDVAVKLSINQPANKPMQAIAGTDAPQNSQATYQGIIDMKTWSADDIDLFPIFLLTDNNRLGEVRTYGDMYGLRGYFRTTNIPTSAKYNISSRKPATTGLVDHKGRPVDVEKFVREGRAYIRVGETLYTLDGQKVGR